jgi:DnaJ like chaperone protein
LALSGKVIGAGIGLLVGGGNPLGAVIGGIIGHFIKDAPLEEDSTRTSRAGPDPRQQAEEFYFVANLVGICAAMMKADGDVHPEEVQAVRRFFERLGYRGESMEIVKKLLKESLDRDLDLNALCLDFKNKTDYSARLLLMECLSDIAAADGHVHPAERAMMDRVGSILGVTEADKGRTSGPQPSAHKKSDHEVLGIPHTASTDEIKRAYRELAMKYHPDRVAHLGDEFKDLAHKKFVEIQQAYDRLTA